LYLFFLAAMPCIFRLGTGFMEITSS
jgi:hypothetical protein